MCVCAVLGKMWGGQGMNNGSTQQLTWSCSLWGLYTQMPTTRENEIQEQLLDQLSVWVQHLQGSTLYVYAFPTNWPSPWSDRGIRWGHWWCLCWRECWVCLSMLVCVASSVYIPMCCICVFVCGPTDNTCSASLLAGFGAHSCSSLGCIRLQIQSPPN